MLIANIGLILGIISSCVTIYQVLPKKKSPLHSSPGRYQPQQNTSPRTFSWIAFTTAFLAVIFLTIAILFYGLGEAFVVFLVQSLHVQITNGEFLFGMVIIAIILGMVFGRIGGNRNIR